MLKPLANIKTPDLVNFDRQSVVSEIIERIQLDPDWNNIYDGDLFQNASQMIINLFAYLFEKNAVSFNKQIKENFINKATSEEAIYEYLRQNKISVKQNTEAVINVIGALNNGILRTPLVIPRFTKLSTVDLNNDTITFELISKTDNKYNYLNDIVVFSSNYVRDSFRLDAYSGETFQLLTPISDKTFENFKLSIPNINIIEDSIRIYYQTSYNTYIELLPTESFVVAPILAPPTFPNGIPHYIISYKQNGSADIFFGSNDFGSAFFEEHIGGNILIFGRSGGGKTNNIIANTLNQTITFNYGGTSLDVTFTNLTAGSGGSDRETIYDAQYIAPLRYGRGRAIIDELDAKGALYQSVIKHKIETPQYSEISSTIPLLHAYHWIVPQRDFEDYVIPEVSSDDTLTTYTEKFLLSLNTYCNLYGINDGAITDENITDFFYENNEGLYQYLYDLESQNILSGSLVVTAYNHLNLLVDQILFEGNYYNLNNVVSSSADEPAIIRSNYFASINIVNNVQQGQNNILKFRLNGDSEYIFTLTIPVGTRTSTSFASALQSLIQNKITTDPNIPDEYGLYSNYEFFSYESNPNNTLEGRIVFKSFDDGENSSIEILDPLTTSEELLNLLNIMGWRQKVYRPETQTEKVFKSQQNVFHYDSNELLLNINENKMFATATFLKTSAWDQNTGYSYGPLLEYTLKDKDDSLVLSFPHLYKDIIIYAKNDSDVVVDSLSILNVQDTEANAVTTNIESTETFFKDIADNIYNYETSELSLRLLDPILATQYMLSFPQITKITLFEIVGGIKQTPSIEDFYEENAAWHQDVFDLTGPQINLSLTTQLEDGKDYQFEFYALINQVLTPIGNIDFYNIDNLTVNQADNSYYDSVLAPDGILDLPPFSNTTYDPDEGNGSVSLQCIDGTINPAAQPYYNQGYDNTVTYIEILYKEKTFDRISAAYLQNPYRPLGETLQLKNQLNTLDKRMLCLENVFKTVRFIPIGLDMMVSIDENFSSSDAYNTIIETIKEYFSYDNNNYFHSIGNTLSGPVISNIINQNIQGYGIKDIVYNTNFTTLNSLDAEILAQSYFFLLDDSILDQLKELEQENANIVGIYDMFALKVSTVII